MRDTLRLLFHFFGSFLQFLTLKIGLVFFFIFCLYRIQPCFRYFLPNQRLILSLVSKTDTDQGPENQFSPTIGTILCCHGLYVDSSVGAGIAVSQSGQNRLHVNIRPLEFWIKIREMRGMFLMVLIISRFSEIAFFILVTATGTLLSTKAYHVSLFVFHVSLVSFVIKLPHLMMLLADGRQTIVVWTKRTSSITGHSFRARFCKFQHVV